MNKEITYREAMAFIQNCEHTGMLTALSTRANSRKSYLAYCKTKSNQLTALLGELIGDYNGYYTKNKG